MKKITLIIITALFAASCNNANDENEKRAQHEKDSLQAVINQQDSSLKNYLSSFSEIEHTLDSINIKQKNIFLKTEKPSDLKTPLVVEEINNEIMAINSLLEKNRKKITQLNTELKSGNSKNKQLEDAIKTLNAQLIEKEKDLSSLNAKLIGLNVDLFQLQATVGLLNSQISEKDNTIIEETAALHKAFFIIGTTKELEKDNVIDKKGGLLGIGKTSELNNNFDASKFTEVDYTQTGSIPLNSKKINIITSHPNGSYRFEKDNGIYTGLIITNQNEFWKASKYLVIVKGS